MFGVLKLVVDGWGKMGSEVDVVWVVGEVNGVFME